MSETPSTFAVCCAGDGELSGDVDAPPVPWWSVAKTCIAAAALILADRGRLKLDEPLAGRGFTLRQLLRHDAGLRDYAELPEYSAAVDRSDAPWSAGELLAVVRADDPAYPPGGGWTYSNAGYLLVRQMIEQAHGADIEAALQDLVFAPAGISDVRLARTPADLAATAWGNASGYHPGWVYHGLFVGTPRDAGRWMHALMTGRVLAPRLLAMMLERRALEARSGRPWRAPGYGLGLMIDTASPLGLAAGHSGEGPGSVCAVYHFPDRGAPRTAAAFAPHGDASAVEQAAMDCALGVVRRTPAS